MVSPHFSPLSLGQLRSLPVSGKERVTKGERRERERNETGGQRLDSSAPQCQKFHPDFQPHMSKHLSHHQSLTPQLYSR